MPAVRGAGEEEVAEREGGDKVLVLEGGEVVRWQGLRTIGERRLPGSGKMPIRAAERTIIGGISGRRR